MTASSVSRTAVRDDVGGVVAPGRKEEVHPASIGVIGPSIDESAAHQGVDELGHRLLADAHLSYQLAGIGPPLGQDHERPIPGLRQFREPACRQPSPDGGTVALVGPSEQPRQLGRPACRPRLDARRVGSAIRHTG